MLNPRQLAEAIDGTIARHLSSEPLDMRRITADVLAALDREDRRGIDPQMLELIVSVRSRRHAGH